MTLWTPSALSEPMLADFKTVLKKCREHEVFLNCILARPGCPVFVPADAVTAPRDLTVIGELGQERLFSLMPEPGALPLRGGFVTEGDFLATPLVVEEVAPCHRRTARHDDRIGLDVGSVDASRCLIGAGVGRDRLGVGPADRAG